MYNVCSKLLFTILPIFFLSVVEIQANQKLTRAVHIPVPHPPFCFILSLSVKFEQNGSGSCRDLANKKEKKKKSYRLTDGETTDLQANSYIHIYSYSFFCV